MATILVLEDDPQLSGLLKSDLEFEGYSVLLATTVAAARDAVRKQVFDLVLLDVTLPDGTGYDVCSLIRQRDAQTPILFLSARSQEMDKIRGFRLGADDYITKPFSVMELIARVQARLRRSVSGVPSCLTVGALTIDLPKREAVLGGQALNLSPKEFDLLWLMALRPGTVISRNEFFKQIWGDDVVVSTRTLDNQMGTLRTKLEKSPSRSRPKIETVHRLGYKLLP